MFPTNVPLVSLIQISIKLNNGQIINLQITEDPNETQPLNFYDI